MRQERNNSVAYLAVSALLVALAILAYLPGLHGPFVFDDNTNLLDNAYINIHSLDLSSLYQAAFSLHAGPLQRPIAMISFALNCYFAGGFGDTLPFKLTNVGIHAVNGLLVFWLAVLILRRLRYMYRDGRTALIDNANVLVPAAFVAALWLLHPIQLTSVLYVVQRMTALSTLFMLLALICYMKSREQFAAMDVRNGIVLMFVGFGIFWPLGLYSKENAFLLPVFVLVLEYTLYPHAMPWKKWKYLTPAVRRTALAILAVLILAVSIEAIVYAEAGYVGRAFTMTERVLTETRVLVFYILLILVPRLNQFGLFHDDIPLSTSIVSPWTTLASSLILIAMLFAAFALRRRRPLVSLGLLWFFAGHLLESSIFPLEIAQEHRNYLASLGILLVLADCISLALAHFRRFPKWVPFAFLTLLFGGITTLRAAQWSSNDSFAFYEARHHPDSASAQSLYANLLLRHGQYDASLRAVRRAVALAPAEAGFLISAQRVIVAHGGTISSADNKEIIRRLEKDPISPTTQIALNDINNCDVNNCQALASHMETWIRAALINPRLDQTSYFYFMLGRALLAQSKVNAAVNAYRKAYELDPWLYHPLLDLTELYLALNHPDYAQVILNEVRRINAHSRLKLDGRIESLQVDIHKRERAISKAAQ